MVERVFPSQPWQPPFARDWNTIAESADIYERHHRSRDAAQKKQWILPTEWMWVENNTGDREAGEVIEAGDYLLTDFDPMALWFNGQAPSTPVRESTHGVLRVACASGDLERVQVSGIVRALVNVTDANHNFCDAAVGLFVLQSNSTGPHKIVYKPTGTGQLTCAVLLYAAGGGGTEIAEAELDQDMCMTDTAGIQITDDTAYLMPDCTEFEPENIVNPNGHQAPLGSTISMYKRNCAQGTGEAVEEWVIFDVQLRKFCAVAGVESRDECLVGWGLGIAAEWCPASEPTEACEIVPYTDCDDATGTGGTGSGTGGGCDTSLVFDPLYACCGVEGTGGSGT